MGGPGGMPPNPVKISHKKDSRQMRPHRFHVSRPPYPAAGSANVKVCGVTRSLKYLTSALRSKNKTKQNKNTDSILQQIIWWWKHDFSSSVLKMTTDLRTMTKKRTSYQLHLHAHHRMQICHVSWKEQKRLLSRFLKWTCIPTYHEKHNGYNMVYYMGEW